MNNKVHLSSSVEQQNRYRKTRLIRSKSRDYCDKEEDIKALSIVRPSGSRIASGEKTLEVRRWKPNLAPSEDLLIVENGRFLHDDGDDDENGTPVAIVKVKTVRPFTLADMETACASYFEDGWFAWELTDVRPIHFAKPVIAARGIYEVDFPLVA